MPPTGTSRALERRRLCSKVKCGIRFGLLLNPIQFVKGGDEFFLAAIAWMADGRYRNFEIPQRRLRITPDGNEPPWLKHRNQPLQQGQGDLAFRRGVATV